MNILLAGFTGNDNSAKLILDKASPRFQKLYLENDFDICAEQIQTAILSFKYDFILALGQKPVIKSIYIETSARKFDTVINSQYNYSAFATHLNTYGFKTKISINAGNYLCNHVYFHGLAAIDQVSSSSHLLFLHMPTIKNIPHINHLSSTISSFLETL